jgi:hypothetical protein
MAPVDDSTRAHTMYVDACRVVRIIPKLAERIRHTEHVRVLTLGSE